MARFDKLIALIEPLHSESVGEMISDRVHKGTDDDLRHFSYLVYTDTIHELITAVYEIEEKYPEYRLNRYGEILEEYGIEWEAKSMKTADVSDMNIQGVLALLMGMVRSERFCDGSIMDFFGIDMAQLITIDYILQQALKAGYTAAVMSLVMEIAPKMCEAIIMLVKNGEIDPQKFKELGMAAVRGPALGFVRGYVSCALTVACNSGKLGPQFVGVQGNVVAAITVLVMDTVKNAFFVAAGKMTAREMSVKTEDAAIISMGALIGGSIGATLLPQLAVLGYMVGSFVGSVIGTIVTEGKNAIIIALCANTGITLFGLVDQNYSLSKEMIESLGLSVVSLEHVELRRTGLKRNELRRVELNRNELKHLDFVRLHQGVIGVRGIGYM